MPNMKSKDTHLFVTVSFPGILVLALPTGDKEWNRDGLTFWGVKKREVSLICRLLGPGLGKNPL